MRTPYRAGRIVWTLGVVMLAVAGYNGWVQGFTEHNVALPLSVAAIFLVCIVNWMAALFVMIALVEEMARRGFGADAMGIPIYVAICIALDYVLQKRCAARTPAPAEPQDAQHSPPS